jgi:nitrogen fixation NifU-like protein
VKSIKDFKGLFILYPADQIKSNLLMLTLSWVELSYNPCKYISLNISVVNTPNSMANIFWIGGKIGMGDTLDEFVGEIKQQIYEETKEAYGEKAYERWLNPLFVGSMNNPDGHARSVGVCGDTMEIFLKFDGDHRVQQALFQADGCGSSSVCASFAVELSLGKAPSEILAISGELIMETLEGLPKEDEHLAFLAAQTLQQALKDYMIKKG